MAYSKSIRKIQKNGRGSYYVNIPKEILKGLKWKDKQWVEVDAKGNALIITDCKN